MVNTSFNWLKGSWVPGVRKISFFMAPKFYVYTKFLDFTFLDINVVLAFLFSPLTILSFILLAILPDSLPNKRDKVFNIKVNSIVILLKRRLKIAKLRKTWISLIDLSSGQFLTISIFLSSIHIFWNKTT